MNSSARSYLIAAARRRKMVYYSDLVKDCKLNLDLGTSDGQLALKQTLEDISRFEHDNARPMLTAMAIGKEANDHGNGFYDLAEEFGYGKNKLLHADYWGMQEATRVQEFWQDEENFQRFEALGTSTPDAVTPTGYFSMQELKFFKIWQGRAYIPTDAEHVNAKEELMQTVWEKTIAIGQAIAERLPGFTSAGGRYWSQRGWTRDDDGNSVQAAIFKHYTWIKIFRNTDDGRDIYFTFGVDAHPNVEAFVYKLDCQNQRDSVLSETQINLVRGMTPPEARWNEIPFEDVLLMSQEALVDHAVGFIERHLAQYDAIIEAAWGNAIPAALFQNRLIERLKPQSVTDEAQTINRTFAAVTIDFQQQAQDAKRIGNAGEALVLEHEKRRLIDSGMPEKAAQVRLANDGNGYDLLSFDEVGNEKFIEVKTTTGDENSPFFLSENEISFMREKQGQYVIYRLYHFDESFNFGEFFVLHGDVEGQLLLRPTAYQAWVRSDDR